MRCIDVDPLIADLEHDVAIDCDTLDFEELTEINRANIQFDKDCKQNAIDLLKNAPTIEPERKNCDTCRYNNLDWDEDPCDGCTGDRYKPERKTGKWIDQKGGGCCCSECGRYALDEVDGNFIHVAAKSNYCPNCGAKMEEGEQDER